MELGKGGAEIITVEELERRKDRFRKATKEYYEQAERGFRCLHGFCGNSRSDDEEYNRRRKRKRMAPTTPKTGTIVASTLEKINSLKRCRRRRSHSNQNPKSELEAELARCLLESHFAIVELAIQEYLFSIENLIRPVPNLNLVTRRPQQHQNWQQQIGANVTYVEGEGFLLRLPSISPISPLSLPLPLPVAFDKTQQGECVQTRLHRHVSEAVEEQHMAMASVMVAVRETKVTEELAKRIHNSIKSIHVALRKISALIEANRNNTFYCCHYNFFQPDSGASSIATTANKKSAMANHQKDAAAPWNRTVVEALKLDGYYRWFRANNGELLMSNNENNDHNNSSDSTTSTTPKEDVTGNH